MDTISLVVERGPIESAFFEATAVVLFGDETEELKSSRENCTCYARKRIHANRHCLAGPSLHPTLDKNLPN